ncbi:MAG: hypothetical protein AAB964_01980 [Patescibacteria group bacterium]
MGLEAAIDRKGKRLRIQRALTLAIFRVTAQNPRLTFAPTRELVRYLKLDEGNKTIARRINQAFQRLEKKGILERSRERGRWSVSLTVKGERLAEKLDAVEKVLVRKPRRWDGKWRMVIFDVWEYRRGVRDQLRRMLIRAGFYKLQDSVWVYPYDCEDLLVFLRTDLQLGKSVLYIIADGIENDSRLRAHFGL